MVHTSRVDVSPGGSSEAAPPVPIPNTVVKRFSAYDTALATEWENRSPPGGIPLFTDAPSLLHLSSLRPWCLQPQVTLRQPPRMDSAHTVHPYLFQARLDTPFLYYIDSSNVPLHTVEPLI